MTTQIGSLAVSLSLDSSSFNGSMAQVDRNLKAMGSELKAVKALGEDYGKSLDGLKSKKDVLSRSVEAANIKLAETRKKYDELKTSGNANEMQLERLANKVNQAQTKYNSLKTELDQVDKSIKTQSSSWYQLSQKLEPIGTKFKTIGEGMTSIGQDLTMKVTAPLTALGVASAKTAIDFEAQMDRVGAIAGSTADDMEKLSKTALELGANTSKSASEVAVGMEIMAAMGYKTNEILSAMPGVISAAEASGEDMALVADVVSSALNAWGLAASDASRVADVLAQAANDSAAGILDMQYTFKYAAPVASQLGVSLEELAAATEIMANNGIKGETAGTALRGSLLNLVSPTADGTDALEKLGVKITDVNGQMLPFSDIVGQISTGLEGMTNVQKATYLEMIFGREAVSAMMTVIEAGPEKLDALTNSLENSAGASAEAAAKMKDNVKGALEELSGTIETAAITVGDILAPTIRQASEFIKELVEKFQNLSPEAQKTIIAVGGIAAAIGPLLVIGGTLVSSTGAIINGFGTLSGAIAVTRAGATAATPAVATLAGAINLLRGPVGWATLAIGGLSLVYMHMADKAKEAEREQERLRIATQESAKESVGLAQEYDALTKKLSTLAAGTEEANQVKSRMSEIMSELEQKSPGLVGAYNNQTGAVKSMTRAMVENAIAAVNMGKAQLNAMKQQTGDKLSIVKDKLQNYQKYDVGYSERRKLAKEQTELQDLMANYKIQEDAINAYSKAVIDEYAEALKTAGKLVQASTSSLESSGKSATSSLNSVGKSAGSAAKKIKSANDTIKESFQNSMDYIADEKYFERMSLAEELVLLNSLYDKYKNHAEQRKQLDREIYRVKKEIEREGFESSKEYIDKRKYYGQMSLDEELKAWERVQARYKVGTEERKQLDREVYRVKNELEQQAFENSKRLIADHKYYNQLSLIEELKAWEELAKQYEEGSKERVEVDREVYRVKKEINDKLTDLNNDYANKMKEVNDKLRDDELQAEKDYADKVKQIKDKLVDDELKAKDDYESKVKSINDKLIDDEKRVTEEYKKAVEDKKQSLYSFAGIFDEVSKKDVSGAQLLKNLEGQVTTFKDWQTNIDSLTARGLNEELVKELQDMGPKAASEIAALTTLSDGELQKYAQLWQEKHALAKGESLAELEGLKVETQQKLEDLRSESANELEQLRIEYNTKIYQLRIEAEQQIEQHKNEWLTKVETLRKKSNEQMELYKTEWMEKVKEVTQGTKTEFDTMAASMSQVGVNTMTGLMAGLESMRGELMAKAKSIADSIRSEIESALEIASPSKVMKRIGAFVGEGLAIGMESTVKGVARQADALANAAVPNITSSDNTGSTLNSYGGNSFKIYVQGGSVRDQAEELMRELHRLGVKF